MKIRVYTTPTCIYCKRLKEFLKENKVEYEEIDVSRDHLKAEEMVKVSGQMGVPVSVIDGQVVIGFDKEKIKELLKIE